MSKLLFGFLFLNNQYLNVDSVSSELNGIEAKMENHFQKYRFSVPLVSPIVYENKNHGTGSQ